MKLVNVASSLQNVIDRARACIYCVCSRHEGENHVSHLTNGIMGCYVRVAWQGGEKARGGEAREEII